MYICNKGAGPQRVKHGPLSEIDEITVERSLTSVPHEMIGIGPVTVFV